ncbi:MAG: tetratricopeptide repeat protein [Desulfobacterales bacterium]|jgi:tetratricopeptide (TPR) repeat protein|nr:tetratricopeptide repeat protein [Desulfobacterales bacterium]
MSHHSEPVHRDPISNGHFLLSKISVHDDLASGHPDIISVKRLQEIFPDLLIGDALMADALKKLYSAERFSAFVAAIDGIAQLIDPNDAIISLAGVLESLCGSFSGFWGLMDHGLLACFLPGKDEADCRKAALMLQETLSRTRNETISIGIAAYPTIAYKKNQILENAKKALDHAAFFGPGSCVAFDSVSLNISGDKYYQNGDLDGALGEFMLALKLDENNVNVHNSIGVCYGIKNQLDNALDAFKTAIRLDPNDIMPVYNAGYVHFLKHEHAEALEYFLNAGRIDGSVFELAIQTGRVYLELNQPVPAKKHLEIATRMNPKSAAAFRLFGESCAIQDLISEATAAYKTCLKLNPDDCAAQSALGFLYEMQEQNSDIALMLCKQAAETEPDTGLYSHRLGRLYMNRKHYNEALVAFRKATDAGFDSSDYTMQTLKLMK